MVGRRDSSARRETLGTHEQLRRTADYKRCYQRGRRRHGALAVLYVQSNGLEHPRLGITASRKVGNSVVRHRLKRRIREIYRRWTARDQLPPVDLVVHLKPTAKTADFQDLKQELISLLGMV